MELDIICSSMYSDHSPNCWVLALTAQWNNHQASSENIKARIHSQTFSFIDLAVRNERGEIPDNFLVVLHLTTRDFLFRKLKIAFALCRRTYLHTLLGF